MGRGGVDFMDILYIKAQYYSIVAYMRNVTLTDYFAEFTTKNISILPAPWIKQNSDSLLPDDGLR